MGRFVLSDLRLTPFVPTRQRRERSSYIHVCGPLFGGSHVCKARVRRSRYMSSHPSPLECVVLDACSIAGLAVVIVRYGMEPITMHTVLRIFELMSPYIAIRNVYLNGTPAIAKP